MHDGIVTTPRQPPDPGVLPPAPRVRWRPDVSREAVLAEPCEMCSAAAGDPCDGRVYTWFILGYYVEGMDGIHAVRYKAAVAAAGRPFTGGLILLAENEYSNYLASGWAPMREAAVSTMSNCRKP